MLFEKGLLALNPEVSLLTNVLGLSVLFQPLLDLLVSLRQACIWGGGVRNSVRYGNILFLFLVLALVGGLRI